MKRYIVVALWFVLVSLAVASADTIKHRFHSPVADEGDPNEVGPDEWNDSLIMDGGSYGNIPMRDPTATDGWRWVTPVVAPTSTATPSPAATATPTATPTATATPTPSAASQDVSCTDTGDASLAALTINPSAPVIRITNNDADGCDITMSEATVTVRQIVMVVVSNAGGTVNMAVTAGVSDLSAAFNMAINDSISLLYTGSSWVEVTRSNN